MSKHQSKPTHKENKHARKRNSSKILPSPHLFHRILFPTRIYKCLRLGCHVLHPLCARRLPRRRRVTRNVFWYLKQDRNRHDFELPVVRLGPRKRELFLGFRFRDLKEIVIGHGYIARCGRRATDGGGCGFVRVWRGG